MKLNYSLIFLFFISISLSFCVVAQNSNVVIVEISDTIDQSTVEILKGSIQLAKNEYSQVIILLLDTPGGGLKETFEIADMINNSEIPIIGYVYPSGSAAWSAGTFILISTHIAAMADYTIIGSCQPVEISIEGSRLINDSKTINALVKWIETRAEIYNRNKTIVSRFITENLNLNESSAIKYGVIEYKASSIGQLLKYINGSTVKTSERDVVLDTRYVKQIQYTPSISIQFMKFFSNPILTSLLLILGIFAVIFGISAPGYGAEIFGLIAILLSLIGSGFSVSTLSIIFIVIGCLLLIIEIFVFPGFGLVGLGGIISLLIGGILLIPGYPNREWLISRNYMTDAMIILLSIGIIIAVFFVFLLYKVIQAKRKKVAVGTFIGERAETIDRIPPNKQGYVRFKGEYWKATSDSNIEPNTKVIIVDKEESVLKVKLEKDN
jgi:membrane-bound serine protease (ClpP class)